MAADINSLLEQIVEEETQEEQRDLIRPNPEVLIINLALVEQLLNETPDANENVAIFYITQRVLLAKITDPNTLVKATLAYYLETYRALKYSQGQVTKLDHTVYNTAALSLFDLYKALPQTIHVRTLLHYGAHTLYQIITHLYSQDEEDKVLQVLSFLANVSTLTTSLRDYTRGKLRGKNLAYVEWVKSYLEKCLVSKDSVEDLMADTTLRHVVPQITRRAKVIIMPKVL